MARASYGSPSANEPHGPGPHALRRLGARALVGSRSQHGRLRERFADYPRRNDALCAPIGDSGHALPPPWVSGRSPHRISRLVTESALHSRVPYSPGLHTYIHPSPTALTCYLARRPARRQI